MRNGILSILCLGLFVAIMAGPAAAKRVALVIGNDRYADVPVLQKAVNDARAMVRTLEEIGFEIVQAEDATRREMNRQVQSFASRLEAGDEALFFYAGHGVEINGRNYLLPTDIPAAKPGREEFIRAEAIPVDQILQTIRNRGTRVSILILDACRNNPFPTDGTRSLGSSRGLARMPAPEGTFIMYSAGVGQAALDRLSDDDPHPNSVFTRSLIPLIKQPSVSLIQAARQVRRDVQKLASSVSHDQRPAYYDEVTGDFFIAGKDKPAQRPVTAQQKPPAIQAWNVVKDTTSAAVLDAFVKEFPDSVYASFAKARLKELAAGDAPAYSGADVAAIDAKNEAETPQRQADNTIADERQLVRAIQTELNRHRCNAGTADGAWGRKSRRAAKAFAKYAKVTLSPEPSGELLDRLRSENGSVCPLRCGRQYQIKNGSCVLKTCAKGERLSKKGNCIVKRACSKRNEPKDSCGTYWKDGVCYTSKDAPVPYCGCVVDPPAYAHCPFPKIVSY